MIYVFLEVLELFGVIPELSGINPCLFGIIPELFGVIPELSGINLCLLPIIPELLAINILKIAAREEGK